MSTTDTQTMEAPLIKLCGPARSGKTRALAGRVIELLERGTSPEDILVVFPTALAAQSFAARLAAAAPTELVETASQVRCKRVLDICSEIVERGRVRGLTSRYGRVLPAEEYLFFIEDLKTLGQKNQRLHNMLAFFYAQWSNCEPEGEWVIAGEESTVIALTRELLTQYQGGLRHEVPYIAAQLLQDPVSREAVPAIPYVFCDDYQDFSHAEQVVVSHLVSRQLIVAGDGAETTKAGTDYPYPQGFDHFESVRHGVHVLELAAIENSAAGEVGRRSWTLEWETPEHELSQLPALIHRYLQANPQRSMQDVTVAVPTRFWGRQVERVLKSAGFATSTAGMGYALGGDPRAEHHHKHLTDYASILLAANPQDVLAWRLWSGFDHALTRSDLWLALRRRAKKEGISLYEALAATAAEAESEAAGGLSNAAALWNLWNRGQALITAAEGLTGLELLQALAVDADGCVGRLAAPLAADDDAQTIRDRIRSRLVSPIYPEDIDGVRIVLYEAMAGCDADLVVLPGLVNGLVPRRDAFDIIKDASKREKMVEEDTCRLHTAASKGRLRVGSFFREGAIEIAERAHIRVDRIASKDGVRKALISPSDLLGKEGLMDSVNCGVDPTLEELLAG